MKTIGDGGSTLEKTVESLLYGLEKTKNEVDGGGAAEDGDDLEGAMEELSRSDENSYVRDFECDRASAF